MEKDGLIVVEFCKFWYNLAFSIFTSLPLSRKAQTAIGRMNFMSYFLQTKNTTKNKNQGISNYKIVLQEEKFNMFWILIDHLQQTSDYLDIHHKVSWH